MARDSFTHSKRTSLIHQSISCPCPYSPLPSPLFVSLPVILTLSYCNIPFLFPTALKLRSPSLPVFFHLSLFLCPVTSVFCSYFFIQAVCYYPTNDSHFESPNLGLFNLSDFPTTTSFVMH